MNTKSYLGIGIFLLLAGVVGYALNSLSLKTENDISGVVSSSATSSAEVLAVKPLLQLSSQGSANYQKPGDHSPQIVRSGDFLEVPGTLTLAGDATAIVYFPDGSQARMTHNARVVILETSYDRETTALRVRLGLEAGRLWSKIIELVTPDSKWEVETASAVATVRGTAFDISVSGTTATIFTASEMVTVAIRDPESKQVIVAEAAQVAEGKVLSIGEKELSAAKKSPALRLTPSLAPSTLKNDLWVQDNAKVDVKMDEVVAELKRGGAKDDLLRGELRERASAQLEEALPLEHHDRKIPAASPSPASDSVPVSTLKQTDAPDPTVTSVIKTETSPISTPKTTEPIPKPVVLPAPPIGLEVLSQTRLTTINQGTQVTLRALLRRADDKIEDVTKSARWQVVGPIGRFIAPGQFLAELDAAVSETGEGSGSIVAIWKDLLTGESFLGKSPIFKVLFGLEGETGIAI